MNKYKRENVIRMAHILSNFLIYDLLIFFKINILYTHKAIK